MLARHSANCNESGMAAIRWHHAHDAMPSESACLDSALYILKNDCCSAAHSLARAAIAANGCPFDGKWRYTTRTLRPSDFMESTYTANR